jgi:hypothetical protein
METFYDCPETAFDVRRFVLAAHVHPVQLSGIARQKV